MCLDGQAEVRHAHESQDQRYRREDGPLFQELLSRPRRRRHRHWSELLFINVSECYSRGSFCKILPIVVVRAGWAGGRIPDYSDGGRTLCYKAQC